MSLHDLYVISPYAGMAGVAILIILLDLVVPRKGLLPVAAVAGLLAPLILSLVQLNDLVDGTDLLADVVPASVLAGTLSVDRFALILQLPGAGGNCAGDSCVHGLRQADAAVPR